MVIEQFLPGFHYGDAIGNSVLSFHNYLTGKGIKSMIIAITIDEEVSGYCIPFSEYRENPESIKIYHYAISSPLNDYFINKKGNTVLIYHNITPSEYFKGFSVELEALTGKGRSELSLFSDKFDLVIADSYFNARELKEFGFRNIKTFPIMISRSKYDGKFSRSYLEMFKDGKKNIVFVGRVTPNKKIEDLIKFISIYKKLVSDEARLIVAGNLNSVPEYFSSLLTLKNDLGLGISDLFFTGHIPFCELLSVYKSADIFLSMSEHEGFCLPLIESSFFKIPVLAYDAGAVKETLNGSGILFRKKDMEKIAVLAEKLMNDEKIRSSIRINSEIRAESFEKESDPGQLLKLITEEFDG